MTEGIAVLGGTGFVGRHMATLWHQRWSSSSLRFLVHRSQPDWMGACGHAVRQIELGDRASFAAAIDGCAVLIDLLRPSGDGWLEQTMTRILPVIEQQLRCVVRGSSVDVYGAATATWVTETTDPRPISPYAREHLGVEHLLARGSTPATTLRMGAIFGTGGRNLISMAEQMAREPTCKLALRKAFNGKRRFHLVSVETVAEALFFFAQQQAPGQSESVLVTDDADDDNNFTFVQQRFARAFGRSIPTPGFLPPIALQAVLAMSGRNAAAPWRRFSNAKLERLGFKPSAPFCERLDRYASHLARDYRRLAA